MLIERARGESVEDRKATYNEVQAFLADQVPGLAIVSWANLAGVGNNVQGLTLSGISGDIFYDTVWLQP
jgi:ABC-type transport system substrate-binding protein